MGMYSNMDYWGPEDVKRYEQKQRKQSNARLNALMVRFLLVVLVIVVVAILSV